MKKFTLSESAGKRTPLLCFDTCSLLDVMRDPLRKNITQVERRAVMRLLSAAEAGKLLAFTVPRVVLEYGIYCDKVQSETEQSIEEFRDLASDIEEIDVIYGGQEITGLPHLEGHHVRAHSVACRWLKTMYQAEQADSITDRASKRVQQGLAPARRTGSPMGDSIIFESYLNTIEELRNSGYVGNAVFISSNIKDYLAEWESRSVVYYELNHVMKPLGIRYAKNYEEAEQLLGLSRVLN